MEPIDKFEEYKLIIDDTARFTERRQTISSNYVAINSLLLGGIGLLVKDIGMSGTWVLLVPIPLVAAGMAVSLWWRELTFRNKALVRLRMRILRDMETKLTGAECIYHCEDELYPRDERDEQVAAKGISFSDLEGRLPLLFMVLYLVFGVGILGALIYRLVAG
jgi:hypothetical protein